MFALILYNIVKTVIYTMITGTFALVNEGIKQKMLSKFISVYKASEAKEKIDNYEKNYPEKEIVDAMKLEGATDNQIEEELEKNEEEKGAISVSENDIRK